jgi:hypothetical protein
MKAATSEVTGALSTILIILSTGKPKRPEGASLPRLAMREDLYTVHDTFVNPPFSSKSTWFEDFAAFGALFGHVAEPKWRVEP